MAKLMEIKYDDRYVGACWAFVIADSIQSQFAIEMKNLGYKPRIRHLAPQEMVDCFKEKFPGQKLPDDDPLKCYTNSFENGFEYVKKYGICEEKDYPYMGKGGCCQDCLIEGPKYFIDNYEVVDQQDVIAAIEQMPLPCGIAFLTKESDKLLQHTEGIIQTLTLEEIKKIEKERKKDDKKEGEKDKKEGKKDIMFHAVLIVGYGKEEDGSEYFLIKNTLGEMWGKLGYGKLDRSGAIFFTRQTKTIFKEGPQLV